ncbi:MAG: hypothetical protein II828_08205 [Clostridia bacterium]|nr:hypothetical protein [Clostridia bacterium]
MRRGVTIVKYEELTARYPEFIYHGFTIDEQEDGIKVTYHFETVGLTHFYPAWVFPKKGIDTADQTVQAFLFSIGMVELISYWKAACPPHVRVMCGYLSDAQKAWWKKLYFHGLGEFFYTNGIDPDMDGFMTITALDESHRYRIAPKSDLTGCMVPVGGGKDSIVTLHLLSQTGDMGNNRCFMINHRNSALASALLAGCTPEHIYRPRRYLDRTIVELNRKGFLNGHTPLSALIAFSASLAAYVTGKKYVVLSNESSANEASVAGSSINHQYSKSFAFEKDFADYLAAYLPCGVTYFSLLRPLSEIQIAAIFAQLKEFHPVFRSCNAGNAGKNFDTWCLNCSKCLFVTMILSPFLSDSEIKDIFRVNLLDSADDKMRLYFEQLIGLHETKPFECVGSMDEINFALCRAIEKRETANAVLPRLLAYYTALPLYAVHRNEPNRYADYFDEVNLIPDQFKDIVRQGARECQW